MIRMQFGFIITAAGMSERSRSLYPQSEQEIVPIVDFIPIETGMSQPDSLKWQLKHPLDHSETHHAEPQSSLVGRRVATGESQQTSEQKTTSIMQEGFSLNTLPEKHLNRYKRPKIHHRDYPYNAFATELHMHHPAIPRPKRSVEPRQLTEESKVVSTDYRHRHRNSLERSQILRGVLKDVEEERGHLRSGTMIGHLRRKKEQILGEIQQKLDVCQRLSAEKRLLVKQNLAQPTYYGGLRQSKNHLKSAVRSSNQSSLRASATQTPEVVQYPTAHFNFVNPRPPNNSPSMPAVASRPESQIFTFSALRNGIPQGPGTMPGHVKQVSIEVESGEIGSNGNIAGKPVSNCTLCQIVGKRCSFH